MGPEVVVADMTVEQALDWANARQVDRWRMVRAERERRETLAGEPVNLDPGTLHAQMEAEALAVLWAECERVVAIDADTVLLRVQLAEAVAMLKRLAKAHSDISPYICGEAWALAERIEGVTPEEDSRG